MSDEYMDSQCPKCGWDSGGQEPEGHQVTFGPAVTNVAAEMQHGGPCLDWMEKWTCPQCGTEFEFENSSY